MLVLALVLEGKSNLTNLLKIYVDLLPSIMDEDLCYNA